MRERGERLASLAGYCPWPAVTRGTRSRTAVRQHWQATGRSSASLLPVLTPSLPKVTGDEGERAKLLILLERETGFEPATNSVEGCKGHKVSHVLSVT